MAILIRYEFEFPEAVCNVSTPGAEIVLVYIVIIKKWGQVPYTVIPVRAGQAEEIILARPDIDHVKKLNYDGLVFWTVSIFL